MLSEAGPGLALVGFTMVCAGPLLVGAISLLCGGAARRGGLLLRAKAVSSLLGRLQLELV